MVRYQVPNPSATGFDREPITPAESWTKPETGTNLCALHLGLLFGAGIESDNEVGILRRQIKSICLKLRTNALDPICFNRISYERVIMQLARS